MKRSIAIGSGMLVVALVLAVTAFAAEVSRDEYKTAAEPICKTSAKANERILSGVRKEVKEGKLKTAAAKFAKAAQEQASTLKQLEALPQPAADEPRLAKWLSYLKLEAELFATAGRKLKAGDKPGAAQVLKLTNNILCAVAIAATSEAFVMGAKGGLDPEVMLRAINAGTGNNTATQTMFPKAVLDRSFHYGAAMHILMKDIDLAIEQGEELGVPMWVCQTVRLMFKHAIFAGSPSDDLTTMVKFVERGANFEMPKTR